MPDARIKILVPEVNLLNYPLLYVLSFFYDVRTYAFSRFVRKLHPKRLRIIDLKRYISWEERTILRHQAVAAWAHIAELFQSYGQARIMGKAVPIWKSIARNFKAALEPLFFLEHIGRAVGAIVLDNYETNRLRRLLGMKPRRRVLWWVHHVLSLLVVPARAILAFTITMAKLVDGLMNNRPGQGHVRLLYDGTSPVELSPSRREITFSWLVDSKQIDAGDVLFLLPRTDYQLSHKAYRPGQDDLFQACYRRSLNRIAKIRWIIASVVQCIRALISLVWCPTPAAFLRFEVKAQILTWVPLLHTLEPRVYISNISCLGAEEPSVLYMQACGIKTVLWVYGTNSYLYLTQQHDCRFCTPLFCHIICSEFVVWNRKFAEFVDEHPQHDGFHIEVPGPLMSADESVMQWPRKEAFKRTGIEYNPRLKCVVCFDCPSVNPSHDPYTVHVPHPNTAERNCVLLRDVGRLLSDFENLYLILKPKRNLSSGRFNYLPEFKAILRDLKATGRFVIVDYVMNPWLLVAIADACIGMPFESPIIAALHYGRLGLFHDTTNSAVYHRNMEIETLVSHNYDELRANIQHWLYEEHPLDSISGLEMHKGPFPGTNSSARFRRRLCFLADMDMSS